MRGDSGVGLIHLALGIALFGAFATAGVTYSNSQYPKEEKLAPNCLSVWNFPDEESLKDDPERLAIIQDVKAGRQMYFHSALEASEAGASKTEWQVVCRTLAQGAEPEPACNLFDGSC